VVGYACEVGMVDVSSVSSSTNRRRETGDEDGKEEEWETYV
jgi:hypothetical protein